MHSGLTKTGSHASLKLERWGGWGAFEECGGVNGQWPTIQIYIVVGHAISEFVTGFS